MIVALLKSSFSYYMIISDIILFVTLWTKLMREMRKV
jgi:hypothetical protein